MNITVELPPGLTSDNTTYSSPGRWADGSNIRFRGGYPQVIGGWSSLTSEALTGVCRNIHAWTDNSGTLNIVFGTHSALQIYLGGELSDITPTGLAAGSIDAAAGPGWGAGAWGEETWGTPRTLAGPRTWSLSTYGESLIACPAGETIYQWTNDAETVAAPLANAPARVTYALATPGRQIMALGCNEETSGTYNPLCIRFSDIEGITDWETRTTNNAGEVILEGGGRIVAAQLLGEFVAVWTDNALYLGQFIGAIGQAWRFDRIADNCGLVGPNAVAVLGQTAYWLSPDLRFRAWQVGTPPQVIECPIRNEFDDNIDAAQREKIVATTISSYGEVWWHYPDSRDGSENSRYLMFTTLSGTWSKGIMARTAAIDAGVVGFPLMCDPDGFTFYHETGDTANGGALSWFLESSDQYIGNADKVFMVRGVWPDFETQAGPVMMTVKVRQYPQSTVRERGPYTLEAGRRLRDFRASGRVIAMRFEGMSGNVRFGKQTFDVVETGGR